ncbi:hypothetical protein [Legionella londiniensis]|uniref:Uncharacterized protein n=1 Tax=Legionella londiniensis TaxID=45068 RepID=A0A0W0VLL7_9GAMM|nr:hypothetical protein [Legionella londiniensis]KTD20665.1 hypothetical protein Llon_1551 [Legionella londiniensis]STX92864.1 Uncharacterised protein [Legionella londiniensis]
MFNQNQNQNSRDGHESGYEIGRNITSRCIELANQVPGFFTPYRGVADFAKTLVSPVAAPLAFGALTALAGVVALAAPAVCLGSLAVAGIAALAKSENLMSLSLGIAVASAVVGLIAAVFVPVFAIATLVTPFTQTAAIFTRSGASVVAGIKSLFASSSSEEREELVVDELQPTI